MNMQINVAQLLKEPTGSIRTLEIDDTICLDPETDSHTWGEAELIRIARGILVRGMFTSQSQLTCSRCLTLFDYPSIFRVEEEFYPSIDIVSGDPLSPPDDSTTFVIDEHHILDLSEAIRQHSLLAMPMKPLCHPDCAGLCPQCGANLNHSVCHCTPRYQTSPSAALEKLKSNKKKVGVIQNNATTT